MFKRYSGLFVLVILIVGLLLAAAPTAAEPSIRAPIGDKRTIGYFAQWGIYARQYYVKNIVTSGSAEKLTHINYAFSNVKDNRCLVGVTQTGVGDAWADYQRSVGAAESVDGVGDQWDQSLKGNWNQLRKLKQQSPNIKVLISLGGWTWSGGFSDAALPENREAFVASCVDAFIEGNLPYDAGSNTGGPGAAVGVFDGIDIDWEYPAICGNPENCEFRPEDTQNFTALLAEFRRQLDAIDPNLLLTIAAPGGEDKFELIELDQIHQHLDFINLMTYDFHGAWETNGPTNFMAPLYGSPNDPSTGVVKNYYADYAVQAYLNAGVPANKLVLGVPFYGRGWTGVTNANDGLYQSATGPASGQYDPGVNDYKVLKALGYPGFRDTAYTQGYWTFDGNTFWSYDDPASLINKMNYVKSLGLGGAMMWELDGDTPNGELISAVYDGLHGGTPQPTFTPPPSPTTGPSTATPTSGPPTHTPTPTSTPDGTNCDGVLQYVAGTTYATGQDVQNIGNKYNCKVGGWCSSSAAWAYEPGVGMYWQEAWTFVGACGSSPTATPITPTPINTPTPTPITPSPTTGPPTATPTSGPPTVTPTSGPPTHTPTPTSTPDGTNCDGVPQYVAGTTYATGQDVQNIGNKYNCKVGGWCSSSAAWAYEPGVGMYWQEAWTFVQACGSSPTATPVTPTPITPTPINTPTPTTPAPTNTPTPTPTPGGDACTAPLWSPSAIYVSGDVVTHNNHEWRAKWWTQGEEPPGTTGVWEDVRPCAGPTPVPPPTPGPPPPFPAKFFAPYVDVNHYPPLSLISTYNETGLKYYTLAFIISQNNTCTPAWGGAIPLDQDHYVQEINYIRAMGGNVVVSFGGASGTELAQACDSVSSLQAVYQAAIDKYNLNWIDLDIEGSAVADPVSVDRRNKAVAGLQAANPDLKVAYCLPVLPSGLTEDGLNILRNAQTNGVRVDVVNVMAMDYGDWAAPDPEGRMGQYAIDSANSTRSQLQSIGMNAKIGVTPMIGQNDVQSESSNSQFGMNIAQLLD